MGKKILVVGLIGLLLAAGLIVIGCDFWNKKECPGNGECTITIKQGASGLSIDDDSPRSSCGQVGNWNYNSNSYSGGCIVANMSDSYKDRKYGTHGCNCK